MPYTSDKKPGALTAATVLNADDNIVIDQSGDVKKATLTQVEAKVFAAKSALTTPGGTEVTIVRQTDGVLRQVPLANIVPALNIANAQISAGANIVDTKLATINTAGKVTNAAVQAVPAITLGGYSNAIGANKIVARDGSGNFAAGTITASLSGNASTATTATTASSLNPGRTIAISGVVTGTATLFDGSVAITIPTTITNNSIVDADINSAAAIDDTKLATITTAGKVADSATSGTGVNTPLTLVRRNSSGNFSAGTIFADLGGNVTGNVTGNATTATTLATGRTIALTGDVTGTTATFNGSVNVSAATTIAAGAVNTAKLATATQRSLVPVGAVMPFAMNTVPSGWLQANGAAVSRTTYADLFDAIGVVHGAGDSVTTFNLPDLRGIFVRGSGSQTIDGTTYTKTFASKEKDGIRAHNHRFRWNILKFAGGQGNVGTPDGGGANAYDIPMSPTTPAEDETRPANIVLLYCIKF